MVDPDVTQDAADCRTMAAAVPTGTDRSSASSSSDVMANPFLTVEEVRAHLNLSEAKVRRLLAAGEIRSVKIGHARRIPTDALAEYVRGLEEEAR